MKKSKKIIQPVAKAAAMIAAIEVYYRTKKVLEDLENEQGIRIRGIKAKSKGKEKKRRGIKGNKTLKSRTRKGHSKRQA